MLLTFSRDLSDDFRAFAGDWRCNAVIFTARMTKTAVAIKWARVDQMGVNRVRFTLPDADTAQHDVFIDGMFKLDPFARIKTARADFDGASDWLAQKAARID